MKSTARMERSFDRANGHMFMAKASLQYQLRVDLERNELHHICLPKTYLFGFRHRYVDGTGQMLRNPTTMPGHRTDDDYIFDK